jgi:hypothetical protein
MTAVAALALAAGGCAYDYHQRTDRISFRAGDAVRANLERETYDPAHGSIYDVTGLGKNGSVVPKEEPKS